MKYLLLAVLTFTLISCSQDNEQEDKKYFSKKEIESIKRKPFNELTEKEKAILLMILESNKENEK